jgi:hypothetical protein
MDKGKHAEIEQRILILRGQRVIIDSDLAQIYGVQTARLNHKYDGIKDVSRRTSRFN